MSAGAGHPLVFGSADRGDVRGVGLGLGNCHSLGCGLATNSLIVRVIAQTGRSSARSILLSRGVGNEYTWSLMLIYFQDSKKEIP